MKLTATNISDTPQGVHTVLGLKFIKPGASRTFEPHPDSQDRLLASQVLQIEKVAEEVDTSQRVLGALGEPIAPETLAEPEVDEFDAELLEAATDEELSQMHVAKFGKPPHHAAKRATIIAKLVAPVEVAG